MPFITFLCLVIFVCILMGDDGFKIMGVMLAFGVVAGVILGIIRNYKHEDEDEFPDEDEEQERDK